MWSVPAMLAITVLFAPGLLAFLMLAGTLEFYLLKRPEERAARAPDRAEPAPPAEPVPFPPPAHLPSPPAAHPGHAEHPAGPAQTSDHAEQE